MTRHDMIERIGNTYMTSNIEGGEYSYIQEAGSRANLENALGRSISHFKLDIRFEKDDIVVLVETKQLFKKSDEAQLNEYLQQERALHYRMKFFIPVHLLRLAVCYLRWASHIKKQMEQ